MLRELALLVTHTSATSSYVIGDLAMVAQSWHAKGFFHHLYEVQGSFVGVARKCQL